MNTPPPIPEIEDEYLRMAVSSLYNSAKSMHSALMGVLSGKDMTWIAENKDVLFLAETVIRHWGEYFEDDEGIPDAKWN